MKILLISDEESKFLYEPANISYFDDIDLILSAGDLKPEYLSYLVTMAHCPLLYVHGNHDDIYEKRPPEGCDCIDGQLVEYQGLRILGLGGSYRYKLGANQYTEREMNVRIRRLRFALWRKKGCDIVLAHAPVFGLNDEESLAHRGFSCFQDLLDRYQPAFFVHGHVHKSYTHRFKRVASYGKTSVINACERYIIEV